MRDKVSRQRTGPQGKTSGNTPTATTIAQQGFYGETPVLCALFACALVRPLPSFALSPLTARKSWVHTAFWPISAAACKRRHEIMASFLGLQSAREVTVTSCARLNAQYGEAMELGREVMASAMCKVTLHVDRIVLVSSSGFETVCCTTECGQNKLKRGMHVQGL